MIIAAIFAVYNIPIPHQVTYQNHTYNYLIFESSKVSIVPNWETQNKFKEIIKLNNCAFATNGGFYTKLHKPIGLVKANNVILNSRQNNKLFNGYVSNLGIGYETPSGAIWALQTGPMLWTDNQPIKVNTTNDKSARRGAAFTTHDNKLYFVIFYNSQAPVLGPYLNDMPEILKRLKEIERLEIRNAINLDGGGASAFYDGKTILEESDSVGTVLCAK